MKALLIFLVTFGYSMTSFTDEPHDIVVAIIDTGVDVTHPLLKDHLWSNPKEKENGKDNDGNGFAGDIHGWNFASNSSDLSDVHGHGTHIAGIIRQQAPFARVKFMILKYYDPDKTGADNLLSSVKAIRYAIQMNADIINYSGGGDERSVMEEAAVREAEDKGILFVAAAGNDGRNTDDAGYFPAGYKLGNIISVAAMDSQKRLLASSNFGTHSVDIVAPGKNVYSSLPGGKYGYMSGTSQATAWVTGLAANLMLHAGVGMKPAQLKKSLEQSGIKDQLLTNKVRSQVRISSLQASLNFE